MGLPSLSILITSFNTKELTLACLQSIETHPPAGEYEVIVVDNDSSDGSREAVEDYFPAVRLVCPGKNLGFAGANNLALSESKFDIAVLLNSDTEVHANALENLQTAFRDRPEMAAAGGRLLNSDGTLQTNIRYFPNLTNVVSETFFLHRLFSGPTWNEIETRPDRYENAHEVDWLSGAYIAVGREWYDRVGGLDEGFFMYSEDTDWCLRINQAGGKIYYLPDSVVTHHGGGSSKGSPNLYILRRQSRDRYFRLYLTPGKAVIARFFLSVGSILRALLTVPVALLRPSLWKSVWWQLQASVRLYSKPLPLERDHG